MSVAQAPVLQWLSEVAEHPAPNYDKSYFPGPIGYLTGSSVGAVVAHASHLIGRPPPNSGELQRGLRWTTTYASAPSEWSSLQTDFRAIRRYLARRYMFRFRSWTAENTAIELQSILLNHTNYVVEPDIVLAFKLWRSTIESDHVSRRRRVAVYAPTVDSHSTFFSDDFVDGNRSCIGQLGRNMAAQALLSYFYTCCSLVRQVLAMREEEMANLAGGRPKGAQELANWHAYAIARFKHLELRWASDHWVASSIANDKVGTVVTWPSAEHAAQLLDRSLMYRSSHPDDLDLQAEALRAGLLQSTHDQYVRWPVLSRRQRRRLKRTLDFRGSPSRRELLSAMFPRSVRLRRKAGLLVPDRRKG